MKTKIIIQDGWRLIKEYDFLLKLSHGDYVEYEGVEYEVNGCVLEVEKDTIVILIS